MGVRNACYMVSTSIGLQTNRFKLSNVQIKKEDLFKIEWDEPTSRNEKR